MTSSRLYDTDDEEDERLQQEEEEERALSERFGEAAETGDAEGTKRKRAEESEKNIAQELDQEEKKAKKVRPQLVPLNLTGADGLIKLPIEMKRIKYKPKKGKKRDVLAAAAYCKKLVHAYRSFCNDLMPSMNFEDVLLKVEQLGAKKNVKNHVQHMKDNVRNGHLERLYGREKAERMLQELSEGLKQHDEDEFNHLMPLSAGADSFPREQEETPYDMTAEGGPSPTDVPNGATSTTLTPDNTPPVDSTSDGEEQEATFNDESGENPVEKDDAQASQNLGVETKDKSESSIHDDDEEEEEEATFEDVMQVNKPPTKDELTKDVMEDDSSSDNVVIDSAPTPGVDDLPEPSNDEKPRVTANPVVEQNTLSLVQNDAPSTGQDEKETASKEDLAHDNDDASEKGGQKEA